MKKIVTILVTVAMVLSCFCTFATAEEVTPETRTVTEADKAWYGDGKATTFTISTAGELAYFMELGTGTTPVTFNGKTIKLGADIVWNDGTATATGFTAGASGKIYQWTPYAIAGLSVKGDFSSKAFQGTFDGQGYSISGLYMSGAKYMGFLCCANNATVKNLYLKNTYMEVTTSDGKSGALVARNSGNFTAENVAVEVYANASSAWVVSGMFGVQSSYGSGTALTFTNCTVDGEITGAQYVGGFVGANSLIPAIFTDCTSYVDITATKNIGGFVARCCANATLTICVALGKLTASSDTDANNNAAFLNLDRTKYQYAADSISAITGEGKATLTDCYYATPTMEKFPIALVASETTPTSFEISVKYGEDDAKVYNATNHTLDGVASTASTTVFGRNGVIKNLFTSLALATGTTNAVETSWFQTTAVKNNAYNLRLVTLIHDENLDKGTITNFGMQVTKGAHPYDKDATKSQIIDTVYQSVTSNYGLETVTAESLGGSYIYTTVIEGIPATGTVTLMVRPYIQTGKTEMYFGAWQILTFTNGTLVGSYHTTPTGTYPAV